MRTKLALAATTALVFLAGACTAGDDTGTADTTGSDATGTTAGEPPTGPAPGVTDDSVKVGITYLDFEALGDVVDIDQGDYEASYTALFDDINADGGINGRMLEPVFAPVSPIGTESAEEACVQLTEDEAVFVVTGFFREDSPACYLEAHGTAMIGGALDDELVERTNVPWFGGHSLEDSQAAALRRMIDDEVFGDNVGVFAITTEASYIDDVALPVLEEAGIEPVDTAVLDAPPDDVTAQNNAMSVIAERFETAGADQVIVMGTGGLTWANGVEPTDYRPQLILMDKGPIETILSGDTPRDLSILDDAIGVQGYLPPHETWAEPGMQDCLEIQANAGIPTPDPATLPADEQDSVAASHIACSNVALVQTLIEAAGPDLNYGTLQQAGEELGPVPLPGTDEPVTIQPSTVSESEPDIFFFDWDSSAEEFVLREED